MSDRTATEESPTAITFAVAVSVTWEGLRSLSCTMDPWGAGHSTLTVGSREQLVRVSVQLAFSIFMQPWTPCLGCSLL